MNKKLTTFSLLIMFLLLSFNLYGCKKEKKEDNLKEIVDFVIDIKEDREIRILQLTDIQIIDGSQKRYDGRLNGSETTKYKKENIDDLAFEIMDYCVEESNPDLIVLTGDNVYGEFDDSGEMLSTLIKKMDSYKIPWCSVFGNHDNETALGVDKTVEAYENAEYSYFKRGNVEGNSNYSIAITKNGKLDNVLFLLDSNGCSNGYEGEAIFKMAEYYPGQIEWYLNTLKNLKEYNNGNNVLSTFYAHITLGAFADAVYENTNYSSHKNGYRSKLDEFDSISFVPVNLKPNDNGNFGFLREDFSSLLDRSNEILSIAKEYGTVGFFFGHDHTNNISVVKDGIRFTFGTKSSKYDYHNQDMLGGTEITIDNGQMNVKHIYY